MRYFFILFAIAGLLINPSAAEACTGITLKSKDGTTIVARTIEWGGSNLNSQYVVVPRGYTERSYTPNGVDGMTFTARYGYVGLAVEQKEFIAEGLNEVGLSAGLFYFPKYGEYEKYNAAVRDKSISDLQLVSWLLGECSNVEEVKEAVLGGVTSRKGDVVPCPGNGEKVDFDSLCRTGGIVNALEAVKLAEKMYVKKFNR